MLLALVMLAAAVAPAGVWRCQDGTPCPMGGAMPRAARAKAASAVHDCCRPKAVSTPNGDSISSSMQCVLTHSDSPAASLVRAQDLPTAVDFGLVLTRSAPVVVPTLQSAEWVILSSDLPPPDGPSARLGRSPPPSAS